MVPVRRRWEADRQRSGQRLKKTAVNTRRPKRSLEAGVAGARQEC